MLNVRILSISPIFHSGYIIDMFPTICNSPQPLQDSYHSFSSCLIRTLSYLMSFSLSSNDLCMLSSTAPLYTQPPVTFLWRRPTSHSSPSHSSPLRPSLHINHLICCVVPCDCIVFVDLIMTVGNPLFIQCIMLHYFHSHRSFASLFSFASCPPGLGPLSWCQCWLASCVQCPHLPSPSTVEDYVHVWNPGIFFTAPHLLGAHTLVYGDLFHLDRWRPARRHGDARCSRTDIDQVFFLCVRSGCIFSLRLCGRVRYFVRLPPTVSPVFARCLFFFSLFFSFRRPGQYSSSPVWLHFH